MGQGRGEQEARGQTTRIIDNELSQHERNHCNDHYHSLIIYNI